MSEDEFKEGFAKLLQTFERDNPMKLLDVVKIVRHCDMSKQTPIIVETDVHFLWRFDEAPTEPLLSEISDNPTPS